MAEEILIRGGHIATCDPAVGDVVGGDLRIRGGRIAEIGVGLDAGSAEVIDATGRLVMPGLIDTHRHVWQGALGAATPQSSLMGYVGTVIAGLSPHFLPEDIYAGTLWGAAQALDAGITTLVDWSHNLSTVAHAEANLRALTEAGVRGFFLYGGPSSDLPSDEAARAVAELFAAIESPRLSLGLAIAGPAFSTLDQTEADFALARDLNAPISVHVGMAGFPGSVAAMQQRGLLGADVNYAHANQLQGDELEAIAASGGSISLCPSVDMLMALGTYPATGLAREHGIPAGLGVDTTTSAGSDLFSEMRLALAAERSRTNAAAVGRDEAVAEVALHPREILDLATLQAARTWRIDDEVGSLTPGKLGDIAVVDLRSPHLDGFDDPVATMVLGAGTSDVETVLVEGVVLKRDGSLHLDLEDARGLMHGSRAAVRGRAASAGAA